VAHTHRGGGFCTPARKIYHDEHASHGKFSGLVTKPPSSMCVFVKWYELIEWNSEFFGILTLAVEPRKLPRLWDSFRGLTAQAGKYHYNWLLLGKGILKRKITFNVNLSTLYALNCWIGTANYQSFHILICTYWLSGEDVRTERSAAYNIKAYCHLLLCVE